MAEDIRAAQPASLQPRTFNPAGVPPPPPTYHHVAVTPLLPSSRLVTLAGLTGCDPTRSPGDNPATLREQAAVAYTKVETCLAAAGATPRDIVQVRHYIVKETGDAEVDRTDVVDRGWGDLWIEFSECALARVQLTSLRWCEVPPPSVVSQGLSGGPHEYMANLGRRHLGCLVVTRGSHKTPKGTVEVSTWPLPSHLIKPRLFMNIMLTCTEVDRTADGHRPPDTVIGVASLAKSDILYECEVWAIVH